MSTTNKSKVENDLNMHWEQTQKHGQDISELKAGQARLEVGVNHLGSRLESGFNSLQSTLSERTQPHPPVPWVQISGLVISMILVLGSVLTFGFGQITASQQRENDLRFTHAQELQKAIHIYVEENIRHNHEHAAGTTTTLTEMRERLAALETSLQDTREHVQIVDTDGSRKWVAAEKLPVPIIPIPTPIP